MTPFCSQLPRAQKRQSQRKLPHFEQRQNERLSDKGLR
jgi:hypothetical protein